MSDEVVNRRVEVSDPLLERKAVGGMRCGVGGLTPGVNSVAVKFTFPENPFRLVIVIRYDAFPPAGIETNVGFTPIVKSGWVEGVTLTTTVSTLTSCPLK